MREIRRWSRSDAEAYEEYGHLMVDMARFIKPVLSITPPDPRPLQPRQWLPVARLAQRFRDLPRRLQSTFIQPMTMCAADFLSRRFETDPLTATMRALRIIGTIQGDRS